MQHESAVLRRPLASGYRWVRVALWLWAIFAVVLCVKVLVEGDRHSVYPAFAGAARDWMAGEVMYDHEGYYYSPTFTVSFIPFALLPDRLGQMLWGLLGVGLYVWSLRAFYRDVLPRNWPREMEGAFLLLTFGGSLRPIWSLQSNTILMASILFAAAAIVRERWWRAAWLLAAPIYIKVWPAIAAGLLSVQWPRKLIGRGIAACAAIALVPFLFNTPSAVVENYHDWIVCITARQADAGRFTGYRDGWTIWEQFASPVNPQAYFVLQAIGGLATLAWCLWLRRKGEGGRRSNQESGGRSQDSRTIQTPDARQQITVPSPVHSFTRSPLHNRRTTPELVTYTLAAWSVWQLLLGPGTERLTYIIIAPFAAWAIITSYLEERNFRLAIVAFITTFFLGAGGIERMLARWIPAAPALQPIGVILFAAWLVRSATRCRAWQNQSPSSWESHAETTKIMRVERAAA